MIYNHSELSRHRVKSKRVSYIRTSNFKCQSAQPVMTSILTVISDGNI